MENLRRVSRALAPLGLTVLRVVVGFVLAFHGWLKLTGWDGWRENIASMGLPAADLFAALGVAGELAGGIGLMLGLLTPIAAFGALCNMLVAIFAVHLPNGLLAQNGGFEYPLVLAVIAIFFLVRGGGPYSLDRVIFARERGPREHERRRYMQPASPSI